MIGETLVLNELKKFGHELVRKFVWGNAYVAATNIGDYRAHDAEQSADAVLAAFDKRWSK